MPASACMRAFQPDIDAGQLARWDKERKESYDVQGGKLPFIGIEVALFGASPLRQLFRRRTGVLY